MKIGTLLVSFLTLVLAGLGPAQADPVPFQKLVVFGESTSDIGNVWLWTAPETGPESWDPDDWEPTPPWIRTDLRLCRPSHFPRFMTTDVGPTAPCGWRSCPIC